MPIPGTDIVVEGHAIVSEDGMIADAHGTMPDALKVDADWRFFQAALDRAALVVLGRKGHANHPNPGRRRLVLTRSVPRLEADPADQLAMFWNPEGAEIAVVLRELGVTAGTIAITGGTGTFDLFEPYYDRFVLSEARRLSLPDGIPCFSKGHPRFVLPGASLSARDMDMIAPGVVQTTWVKGPRLGQVTCG
jgi:hypothetical protein